MWFVGLIAPIVEIGFLLCLWALVDVCCSKGKKGSQEKEGISFWKKAVIVGTIIFFASFIFNLYRTGEDEGDERMSGVIYNPFQGREFRTDLPKPRPSAKQVLVRVIAAGLNPVDNKLNRAVLPFVRWFISHGVGLDFSGEVIESACPKFRPGDQVFGFTRFGSLMQYTVANCDTIAFKPKELDFYQAASLPTAALTSYQALKQCDNIQDASVLIIGASGGCGSVGVQEALAMGAERVVGVCSSKNIPMILSFASEGSETSGDVGETRKRGRIEVVAYNEPNFEENLRRAAGEHGFDLIYDTVSSPQDFQYEPVTRHLKNSKSPYVGINGALTDFTRKFLTMTTNVNLQREDFELILTDQNSEDLEVVAKWVADGLLDAPLIVKKFDPEGVNEGFDLLTSRRARGKVVVEVGKSENFWCGDTLCSSTQPNSHNREQ